MLRAWACASQAWAELERTEALCPGKHGLMRTEACFTSRHARRGAGGSEPKVHRSLAVSQCHRILALIADTSDQSHGVCTFLGEQPMEPVYVQAMHRDNLSYKYEK